MCVCEQVCVCVCLHVVLLNDEQPSKLPTPTIAGGQAAPENGFKLLISAVNDEDKNGNLSSKWRHLYSAFSVDVCVCMGDFEK